MSSSSSRIARYLIFINIIIFSIVVFLHELGHILIGFLAGCGGGGISISNLLNPAVPGIFTTLTCPVAVEQNLALLLGLSGFMFIIPLALFFVIPNKIRKKPEKNLAYVILGFSVILAGLDLMFVVPHNIVVYIALVIGIAIMCAGEVFLAGDYDDYMTHRKQAKHTAKNMSRRKESM